MFNSCKTPFAFDAKPPLDTAKAYFVQTVTGIEVVMPEPVSTAIVLDSVYFKGLKGKFVACPESQCDGYFAKLVPAVPNTAKLVMSSEASAEFNNTQITPANTFPFDLKEESCVISYSNNEQQGYYKIENVLQKK